SLTLLKVAKLRILLSHTLFIGKRHIRLASADSTNNWLKGYLEVHPTAPEGLAITASDQTNGRGQSGKRWESAPGLNLAVSYLLRPTFLAPAGMFTLNKAIALAVRDTVAEFLPETRIKWPNDIFSGNHKVAGILIESSVNSRVQWVVAGIGINVNQMKFGPEAPRAGSIAAISGHKIHIDDLLQKLHIHLEHHYLRLRAGHDADMHQAYLDHLMAYQQSFRFIHDNQSFQGVLTGVDPEGRMIVDMNGKITSFAMGEITWEFD
ncbi:MAG TPA: biotin--[acetyl-CoA-carboxylase] ligase, partial [Chitinophagales bacterium]|nr:biotin--[acetyl-CoA-carboxylase] ligase [Chitinophagales bacterium]